MKRNLLFTILLVFLVVMNGVLLFLILDKPDRKPRPSRDFMVQELGLSEEQTKAFRTLERGHRQRMMDLDHQLTDIRHQLFANANNKDFSNGQRDSLIAGMGELSKAKNLEVFEHFKNIGELCEPKQRKKLERILNRALRHGPKGEGPPPGHGPPPGGPMHGPPPGK